jgi:chromosome segregation ATPase
MNCIQVQSAFQPPRQRNFEDPLVKERRKSSKTVNHSFAFQGTLSALGSDNELGVSPLRSPKSAKTVNHSFAFQGTLSALASDKELVSPLRSPKKRVKTKKGVIITPDGVKRKKKKKTKAEKAAKAAKAAKAEAASKPASRHTKIVAGEKIEHTSRTTSNARVAAAVQIQRIARGWYQRLLYRIMWLQNELDTSDEKKRLALRRIDDRLHMHKYTYREKLERKAISAVTATSKGTKDAQDMIAYLRKANKKLRERNQKLYNDIQSLKHNNSRLEEANAATAEYFEKLKEHVEQLEVINRKLNESEANYKESLETFEEAIELRQHYYIAEHRVKTCYAKSIATIIDLADERCKDDFSEEIFGLCLGLETYAEPPQKPSAPQPPLKDDGTAVTVDDDSDSESDSDSSVE